MARCSGITKSGTRCKRTAPEGEAYCALHADQATGASGGGARPDGGNGAGSGSGRERKGPARNRPIESGEDLFHMAVGMTLAVAIFWLLRKGIRFPGS